MSAPTVCAVMLANGRPEMVKRAVASFRAQNYERKRLIIWDTTPNGPISEMSSFRPANERLVEDVDGISIGMLRNRAAEWTDHDGCSDIICHFDSDDWSHPNRIAEQVALLQSSGAECVGYNEMLFWREPFMADLSGDYGDGPKVAGFHCLGQSWLYRASVPNYAIGTSMCYWRSTWERNPFPDRSEGCDDLYWFNRAVSIESRSAFSSLKYPEFGKDQPRMIASIHGGNTCSHIDATKREWKRVPQWDEYCRNAMRLS